MHEVKRKIRSKNCGNCHWQFISTIDRGKGYTSCAFDLVLRPSKNDKCFRWQEYALGPSPEKRVDMATELKAWEESDEGQANTTKDSVTNHMAIIAAAIIGIVIGFVLGLLV